MSYKQPSTSRPQNTAHKPSFPSKKPPNKPHGQKPGAKLGRIAQMAADAQAARRANQAKKGGKPKGRDGPKQP